MYFPKILHLPNMNFGRLDIYCNLQLARGWATQLVNLIKKNCRVIHKKELRTPVSGFVFSDFCFYNYTESSKNTLCLKHRLI